MPSLSNGWRMSQSGFDMGGGTSPSHSSTDPCVPPLLVEMMSTGWAPHSWMARGGGVIDSDTLPTHAFLIKNLSC